MHDNWKELVADQRLTIEAQAEEIAGLRLMLRRDRGMPWWGYVLVAVLLFACEVFVNVCFGQPDADILSGGLASAFGVAVAGVCNLVWRS